MIDKKLLLLLIRDDLINFKLVSGLNKLGLDADIYHIYLGETVFNFMGFQEGDHSEMLYERIYLAHLKKVESVDFSSSTEKLDELSLEIYQELSAAKDLFPGRTFT